MKKLVAILAMVIGASMSLLAHADMNQGSGTEQPAPSTQSNVQPGSTPNSGATNSDSSKSDTNTTNSGSGSSSSLDESNDDDTAS